MVGPFLLFDDARRLPGRALLFTRPTAWITCWHPDELGDALGRIALAGREGWFAAGYFSYELGYLLEPALATLLPERRTAPLLSFGLWPEPERLAGPALADWLRTAGPGSYALGPARATWSAERYRQAFARAHALIAAGDVYQINLAFALTLPFSGDAVAFYRTIRDAARTGHGALLRTPEETIVSLSPELFFAVAADTLRARPMKGTAARAPGAAEDRAVAQGLARDPKERAENLMIVDLLRNDLGRLATLGSVRVEDLFQVETYPTLHAMTSTIAARRRPDVDLAAMLRALFPCGSVTGAPKIRAMQIIRELEDEPRGVYCGALGWLAPDGDAEFNVAIRTLTLTTNADGEGDARLGIGSGVVFDSHAEAEYEECLLKARFATVPEPPFQLIETLLWRAGDGYWLLDRHLDRLATSATYFLFACDLATVKGALAEKAQALAEGVHRVRLLLSADGQLTVTSEPLPDTGATDPVPVVLSQRRTSSRDPHVRHKTTRRQLYDGELARLGRETGCGEVLFRNERGEVTEAARHNLFVVQDGRWSTPPLACGVLAGCLRAELIARGDPLIEERVLLPADLATADSLWLGNSVRGLRRAVLIAG